MSGPRLSVTPAGALTDVIAGLMRDADLRVLYALGTFTDNKGWTKPVRQIRFAERCGFTRQHVNDRLAVLEWLGWVQVRRAERSDKPAAYRVLLDPTDEREPGTPPLQTLAEFKRKRREEINALKAAEHAARTARAVDVVEADTGAGGTKPPPSQSASDDSPPCQRLATGGCQRGDDSPCQHCDDSKNDSSSRKKETKSSGLNDPTTDEVEWWRGVRKRLRSAIGEYEWRAWGARLRLNRGQTVIVTDERALMDLHKHQSSILRAHGVIAIISEDTQWRVDL